MNVAAAAGTLSERFKDLGLSKFTNVILRALLESAEIYVASKLHSAYLDELETPEVSVAVSSGYAALSALSNNVLGGAQGVREVKLTDGKICTLIDAKHRKDTESYYRKGSTDDPIAWVQNNRIYVLPSSTALIDVVYLKIPDPLYFNFTSNQADSGASKTKFDGESGEGLDTTTTNYYLGAVIFNIEKETYHVVTAYNKTDLEFTVVPEAAANFTEGQQFRFLTHDFDALSLSGVDFSLNADKHSMIIDVAEAAGLAQTELHQQREAANSRAENTIAVWNAKYIPPTRLGTQEQGR